MQDLDADAETFALAVTNIEEIAFGSVDLSEDHCIGKSFSLRLVTSLY